MQKKDILELKRRFKKDACTFTKLRGCYVDNQKNILLHIDETFLNLEEDEFYKYLEIAKKALSGTIGNNLLELSFRRDEAGEEAQRFFLALRDSALKQDGLLDLLYERIIREYDFAGNLIDMDIGPSMATEFNPSMNSETTVTGNFYYYVVLVLLLVSDMHTYLIRAVCDSFSVVPLGGAQFQFDNMLSTMTKYMGDMFVIGFRIFLPVFACMMIMNCILGIMAKVAPQMNMFSVGIQLKIIAGFIVLFLIVYLIPNIANFIITEIKTMVVSIIDGMY